MCCVMPPASPLTTFVSRMASSSDVLPWSTWPMIVTTGGRSTRSSSASSKVGSSSTASSAWTTSTSFSSASARAEDAPSGEGWVGVDDLDLLVERLGEDGDRLVGERLRERDHLAHQHQLLDDLGHRDAEVLGDVLDRRAGVDPDDVGTAGGLLVQRRGGLGEHVATAP